MLDIIIVEDEVQNAEVIQSHLNSWPGKYNVVAVLRSNKEIREWFESQKQPYLVFCDIKLLDGNVFNTLKDGLITCPIIFTTAYDSFYQEAFDSTGIAYLIKPIGLKKITAALQKAESLIKNQHSDLNKLLQVLEQQGNSYRERILVNTPNGMRIVEVNEVVYIETAEGVCKILHSNGNKYMLRYKISELINELDPTVFFRINRGEIINIRFIENIQPYFNDRLAIRLKGHKQKAITSKVLTHSFRKWVS